MCLASGKQPQKQGMPQRPGQTPAVWRIQASGKDVVAEEIIENAPDDDDGPSSIFVAKESIDNMEDVGILDESEEVQGDQINMSALFWDLV